MHITSEMKMADVIHQNIQLLSVMQNLNISLGFREKSVNEVCLEHGVDTNFFLQLTNAFHNKDYFPSQELLNFPVKWIIGYLKNAHQCFINHRIPDIQRQIVDMEQELTSQVKNVDLLLKFFGDYIKEFTSHIELEEKMVFPYILDLNAHLENKDAAGAHGPTFNYSIGQYKEDHNDIEEKLYDLKSILLKYLPPPPNNCKYNNLLYDIFRLENDLNDHSLMEDRVLIPKVILMEQNLNL